MIKNNKGFTLIELLVVVAIIGILSSVVLASLNSARSKAADSNIKANLANARAQAEILFDTDNSYVNVCSNGTVTSMIASAKSSAGVTAATAAQGTAGSATVAACHVAADNASWAISVPLKTSSANAWCVDSLGTSKQTSHLGASVTACP